MSNGASQSMNRSVSMAVQFRPAPPASFYGQRAKRTQHSMSPASEGDNRSSASAHRAVRHNGARNSAKSACVTAGETAFREPKQ